MQLRRILMPCAALVALACSAAAAPDEELLGKAAGYPLGKRATWFYDESVRVGSFSNVDKLLPHYTLGEVGHSAAAAESRRRSTDRVPVRKPDLDARRFS